MAARDIPAANGGAAPPARGPAIMAGLGGAAAFAALSMVVPIQKALPTWLEELAESGLVTALALIGFVVGYLLARKIGAGRAAPVDGAEEPANVWALVPAVGGEAALPLTQPEALAEPLDRLGPVQLVERLAMAVERNPPPPRNTARAAQLSAQLRAQCGKSGAALPATGASDAVADANLSGLEELREVDERQYSRLLDTSLPVAPRIRTNG